MNDTVTLRQRADADAPATITLHKGDRVKGLTGIVITSSPGEMRFAEEAVLDVFEQGRTLLRPVDTLYVLTYRGEGCWAAWLRGHLLDTMCGAFGQEPIVFTRPTSVWWVQIETENGEQGWSDEPARFDDKDVLG